MIVKRLELKADAATGDDAPGLVGSPPSLRRRTNLNVERVLGGIDQCWFYPLRMMRVRDRPFRLRHEQAEQLELRGVSLIPPAEEAAGGAAIDPHRAGR